MVNVLGVSRVSRISFPSVGFLASLPVEFHDRKGNGGFNRSEIELLCRDAGVRGAQVAGGSQGDKQAVADAGRGSVTPPSERQPQSHCDRDRLRTPGHREGFRK